MDESERLDRLEKKLDLIGAAVAELAQKAFPEADPSSPLHGSAHVQARLARHAANSQKVIAMYVDPESSYTAGLERFVRERQAAKRAERMTDEEAEAMNRRLVQGHVPV